MKEKNLADKQRDTHKPSKPQRRDIERKEYRKPSNKPKPPPMPPPDKIRKGF